MESKKEKIKRLNKLKLESKFGIDESIFYPGIVDVKIKNIFTLKINKSIDNFISGLKNNLEKKELQQLISEGLNFFEDVESVLDTEDKERICSYFEEIMDIIGLDSSGGVLNKWLYGFDPR